jgi:hypothetical protein
MLSYPLTGSPGHDSPFEKAIPESHHGGQANQDVKDYYLAEAEQATREPGIHRPGGAKDWGAK